MKQYIIHNIPINTFMTEADFRTKIRCSTYDDELWFFVDEALRRGSDRAKALARKLKGMNVDEAQTYIRENP